VSYRFGETHQWAQAHFLFEPFGGSGFRRKSAGFRVLAVAFDMDHVRAIVERVAASQGLEVVDVELRGGGAARMLRVFIDKPGGVNHEDCANLSNEVGTILDVEDAVPGGSYLLEVSSPGLDRKLVQSSDYERFLGSTIKVTTRSPVEGSRHFEGRLESFTDGRLALTLKPGGKKNRPQDSAPRRIEIELSNVEKANLVPQF
jgi:ribosome maturation factor RimP